MIDEYQCDSRNMIQSTPAAVIVAMYITMPNALNRCMRTTSQGSPVRSCLPLPYHIRIAQMFHRAK